MKLALAVCCVCIFSVCNGQNWGSILSSWGCRSVQKQDCFTYGDHPECGTNGVTYRNRCDYSKAHCADKNIHVAYIGACSSTTVPPTGSSGGGQVGTGPIISGPDAVFDFFCLQLSHIPCENDLETICGSDGATYINSCDYSEAHCADKNIHVAYIGACSSTTVPPTGSSGGGQVGTGPIISGPDAVFDFFCLQLGHIPCENDLETICGSDGATYINSCEFEKERCTHRELTTAKFGKC